MRIWVLLALAAAGCFSPNYESGKTECSLAGECPSGFECVEGKCYRPGETPDLSMPPEVDGTVITDGSTTRDLGDMATPPDLTPRVVTSQPTAAWTSSGGDSVVSGGAAMTKANISLGETSLYGHAVAPSGASLEFGLFSSDSIE